MPTNFISRVRSQALWSDETPPDADLSQSWLLQFTQTYGPLDRVAKRGLNATPAVIAKHAIQSGAYLAISAVEGRHRAVTVFHFHPDVPDANRRSLMEADRSGIDALAVQAAERVGSDHLGRAGDRARLAARRLGRETGRLGEGRLATRLGQAAAAVVGLILPTMR
ncbi:MAG: hypothetical protein ACPGNT_11470 [Rhodospirillales bacterium]